MFLAPRIGFARVKAEPPKGGRFASLDPRGTRGPQKRTAGLEPAYMWL